jgi:hypothetical protein
VYSDRCLPAFDCEAGDEMFFRNVGNHVPKETEVLIFTTLRTSHFIDFDIIIGVTFAYSYLNLKIMVNCMNWTYYMLQLCW